MVIYKDKFDTCTTIRSGVDHNAINFEFCILFGTISNSKSALCWIIIKEFNNDKQHNKSLTTDNPASKQPLLSTKNIWPSLRQQYISLGRWDCSFTVNKMLISVQVKLYSRPLQTGAELGKSEGTWDQIG